MKFIIYICIFTAVILAKTVPSAIWIQKDISDTLYGSKAAPVQICIASRAGEFKEAVVQHLSDSLSDDFTAVTVTGIKALKSISPASYQVVVIINTCMAWQIDNRVQKFYEKNSDYKNVVMITTSADSEKCGKGRYIPEYVDAVSSASAEENVSDVVAETLALVRSIL